MNKMIKTVALLLGVFMVLGLGLGAAFAKKKGNSLTIAGSTTVLPISQRCAEVFMDKNPDVNISVRGGGSGVGVAAIIDGSIDICASSRPITTKEMLQAKGKGQNLKEIPVARDGLAIIVNKNNPVSQLTLQQVRDIYLGKVNNWKEVGGPSRSIVIVSRDSSSGTYESFKTLVLNGGKFRDDALLLASSKAVSTTVAETPGAIGYVGIGFLSDDTKAVKLDGTVPSEETVLNGTYKVKRNLFLYVNGTPSGMIKQFIDFVLSDEGQKIVKDVGYVTIK
jgi:phosphate transport system substrate-binding protein